MSIFFRCKFTYTHDREPDVESIRQWRCWRDQLGNDERLPWARLSLVWGKTAETWEEFDYEWCSCSIQLKCDRDPILREAFRSTNWLNGAFSCLHLHLVWFPCRRDRTAFWSNDCTSTVQLVSNTMLQSIRLNCPLDWSSLLLVWCCEWN